MESSKSIIHIYIHFEIAGTFINQFNILMKSTKMCLKLKCSLQSKCQSWVVILDMM